MSYPVAALSPEETKESLKDTLLHKAEAPLVPMIISGMFAGLMIGLGFVFYTTALQGASGWPVGAGKVLGGTVFSVGLALVVITGSDLFTSTCMTQMLVYEKVLTLPRLLRHWCINYLSNMAGGFVLACIIFASGVAASNKGAWGAVVLNTATHKVEHTFIEAVALGIMCNLMVCLAVWLATAGRTVMDKVIGLTAPVALFVASGFEHSVANMYMIPLALMLKAQNNPAVMQAAGGLDLSELTVSHYLLHNLLPVTIGNILGASIIALGMAIRLRNRGEHVHAHA